MNNQLANAIKEIIKPEDFMAIAESTVVEYNKIYDAMENGVSADQIKTRTVSDEFNRSIVFSMVEFIETNGIGNSNFFDWLITYLSDQLIKAF